MCKQMYIAILETPLLRVNKNEGARGAMVIVVGNGQGDTSPFLIALIPLGKVLIQLLSLQLWVSGRTDWVLQPWWGN